MATHAAVETLLAMADFTRARLLGTLDVIEKSGQPEAQVLSWRPGPGRAHLGWQFMHCAATHHKYLKLNVLKEPVTEEALVSHYGGGSVVRDGDGVTFAGIRSALEKHFAVFRNWVGGMTDAELAAEVAGPGGKPRSLREVVILLIWHEAHHQGQIHLTWNCYKATHGIA